MDTKCHNLGFTRGSDGLVHTTLQDGPGKTVDTAPGERTHQVTRHEGSIISATHLKSNKLHNGSERTLRGNYCHEEHSKVCHGISNDNTEGDTVFMVEVLPSVIINTEVDNCDSISDFNTQRGEKQIFDGIGFINGNKDTQLCCPKIWVKSVSE